MDLADFLPAYLSEVEELMSAARAHLLALEKAVRQSVTRPRTVRDLFRALHTIKGLSAMIDVEPIVSIAHWMEAALRHADQAGGQLPDSSIELLLEGLSAIEQRVRQLAGGKPVGEAPRELLERLEGLESAAQGRTGPKPVATLELDPLLAQKVSPAEQAQLSAGAAAGRRAVRLDYVPSAERSTQGLTINSIRERVSRLAELVKVLPVSGPTPGGGNLTFVLLVLTDAEDAALLEALGGPPATVRLLLLPTASAPPPGPAAQAVTPAPVTAPIQVPATADALLPEEDLPFEELRRGTGILRVEVPRLDDALERLAALVVNRSKLTRAVADLTAAGVPTRDLLQVLQENARLLRDLRASILHLRMVRVRDVLERMPLLVRGLRRATGKQVRLELDVGDAELDKAVADRILPALVHLVRNAMDHAIESPAQRRAAGKPEEGVLRLGCHTRVNGRLELSVSDDGRGVDAAAVAARAGGPVPSASEELLELLCRPGLSTRQSADSTSGRGMGMDIVKRIVVEQLGGELGLETRPGQGTTFTLSVPLTITIVDAFIFECAALRYAVAVSTVEEIIEVDPSRVVHPPGEHEGGTALVERRGVAVPLVSLEQLLRRESGRTGLAPKAFIVRQRGTPVAFAVDRLLGQQEIVLRPLEDPLVQVPGVAGATDLGDGQPTLVLDLPALGAARGTGARSGWTGREATA
ncbi:chemotaxis protein CheA [Stigmatella aurantiaca]|uniref:histidine kinase n=1 Tax=Stigmatella aurantiaca (strain DW4/3-1) TaxID=378806 RepID=E3FZJ9_STIAD|nr:chemotaxis protein CheW [Stigmatella aurantiaca]ADO68664.1 chemotaxis protein, CheA [Stigmatella aurantiaca DW4/3-1]